MIDDVLTRLPDILAVLNVVVAVPLVWYVTGLLWRIVNNDPGDSEALHAVAVMSTCVALIVTVFSLVFLNNTLPAPVISLKQTQIVTRGAMLILAVVPSVYWLRWYRRKIGH